MCLAIPGLVCEILNDKRVMVDITGVRREADTTLLEESLDIGDYVLVHTGFIIQKLDPEQAKEDLKLWDEILSS
ncbi:MAG: HypC/HybG/HupF family hydrogenase formation chaperone [Candidatus Heimdallarchaeota archaeon]|jgi:hydrogenase expression/formation protein HypC|nr:HypC/HybG/HupF family hydrogenase formation chaperone [Candidatus Heimdallarchaeota archaeon]MCG3259937.1 HypC/HybG/HupF family hydrogenase formation chaperone [Candidatus Heimdallarchaeota archaeon]MCK5143956.1 HypC/HybG/HupF family hydrogenase formation chaperone [Candidatus Heimdallarchaeota archaeon]